MKEKIRIKSIIFMCFLLVLSFFRGNNVYAAEDVLDSKGTMKTMENIKTMETMETTDLVVNQKHSITYKLNYKSSDVAEAPAELVEMYRNFTDVAEHGKSYVSKYPSKTDIPSIGGTWRFVGNNPSIVDQVTEDMEIVATWEHVLNNLSVKYSFVSMGGEALPEEVLALLPNRVNLVYGSNYDVAKLSSTSITTDLGTWNFKGFDYDTISSIKENVEIKGVWEFIKADTEEEKPVSSVPEENTTDDSMDISDDTETTEDVNNSLTDDITRENNQEIVSHGNMVFIKPKGQTGSEDPIKYPAKTDGKQKEIIPVKKPKNSPLTWDLGVESSYILLGISLFSYAKLKEASKEKSN